MKKLFYSTAMLLGLALSAQAQDISDNAIGLRLGSNDGFGAEVSYQRGLSKNNRLELDLGWRSNDNVDALKLTGIYQWVWNIDGGFNWYAGAGGGASFWDYDHPNFNDKNDSGVGLFVAGDIGIEYNFDFPLQISLDLRPELNLINEDWRDDNFETDLALGIRYRF